jgi:hypothetical protein
MMPARATFPAYKIVAKGIWFVPLIDQIKQGKKGLKEALVKNGLRSKKPGKIWTQYAIRVRT